MQAIYVAVCETLTHRMTKNDRAPAQMIIIYSGLVKYALLKNHPEKMIASTLAAAGGILRSWFLGRPAKPRSVVTVGNCHCRPYPPRFMSTCETQNE